MAGKVMAELEVLEAVVEGGRATQDQEVRHLLPVKEIMVVVAPVRGRDAAAAALVLWVQVARGQILKLAVLAALD